MFLLTVTGIHRAAIANYGPALGPVVYIVIYKSLGLTFGLVSYFDYIL